MRWYTTAVLIGIGAMALLVGGCSDEDCTTTPPDQEPATATFAGSETCGNCHNAAKAGGIYDQWLASGHPYKVVKIEGEAPIGSFPEFSAYPSDAIDPPQGETWSNITYTIGGYFWKMRWMDADGWIVTSGAAAEDAQYNFETDADHSAGFTTYHTGDERGTKPYNDSCGRCHTTGWEANPDPSDLSGNQDGLAGIHGTFFAGGVHCEECHGKGSLHAADPQNIDMVVDDTSALCGRCHTRDPLNRIMASSGFIRHHEQFDEWSHSPHGPFGPDGGGPGCNDCHDPHASVVYDDVAIGTGVTAACTDCHSATEYALDGGDTPHPDFVQCTQCHMPNVGKSAKAHDTNPYIGDVASHIFAINSNAVNMEEGMGILADGASFIKTENGLARITLDFACYRCHDDANGDGGGGSQQTLEQLSEMADGIHPLSAKSRRVAGR